MKYISTTDTAKLIRAALKESFPGIKFSVKSDQYSGGSSIRVGWIDGPSAAMVEAVAKVFKGSYFDSSQDYKGSTYAIFDGLVTSFGPDYVFCSRENSTDAARRAAAQVARKYGPSLADYDRSRLISEAMYRHSFYLAPRKSKTAGRVIYAGNDGYSQVGALSVE